MLPVCIKVMLNECIKGEEIASQLSIAIKKNDSKLD